MYSEIHNTIEDIVFSQVSAICDALEKDGNIPICTCHQCRLDTASYVLNRVPPHYVISNRGVARVEHESLERQQKEADIAALIYEGIRRVNHNQRPYANHTNKKTTPMSRDTPAFNIPTIVGRLFNGLNFEPLSGVTVELHREGELVAMKDSNWQNPYHLVANTEGTFAFWPAPLTAEAVNIRRLFEFSIKIEAPGFESLLHFLKIPVVSEYQSVGAYSMERTFKLPDLHMFPPGNEDGS